MMLPSARRLSPPPRIELGFGHVPAFYAGTGSAALAPERRPDNVGSRPAPEDIIVFHCFNGHLGQHSLQDTARSPRPGETCVAATGGRASCPHHTASCAVPLSTVFLDVVGPFEASHGGARYMVSFVDSYSRRGQVYGIRTKAHLLAYVRKFIADVGHRSAFVWTTPVKTPTGAL